ncbi:MAG TPA: 1,4-dihydroxy-2-naphthoate polyprenyltransferase, partial [Polyangiaceae bacterium]
MLPKPGSIGAWILAIRPKTLPAAVAPVIVGLAIAHRMGSLDWVPALFCLVGALLLQIASNLANDVFDYEHGKDTEQRLGPLRAVQSGLLTGKDARRGLGIIFVACLAVGSYLVAHAGWPLLVIGVSSMIAAVAYTAGPYPIGYHGLGDVFVFLFFGPVAVMGTEFAIAGTVTSEALWASLPMGALTTNILVVNNLRDCAEDKQTGKRTLAVRFGERFALIQAATLVSLAYLSPAYFLVRVGSPWPAVLPLLSCPLAITWFIRLRRIRGRAMNALLARAAQILLAFA